MNLIPKRLRTLGKLRGLRSRLFLSHLFVTSLGLGLYLALQATPVRNSLVGAIAISLAIATLLSAWLTQRIFAPFIAIQRNTQAFAAGDLAARLPQSCIPEVNQLNRSFNRMAMRLEEVEAKRAEVIGDLAHELRTPLTVIRGYLEEWVDERIKPTPQLFHQLIREVRRLERLVLDLQLLSKAEMGHLPLQLQSVQIDALLEELQQIFESQLTDKSPALHIHTSSGLLIWADPDRTLQILVNLVGNALRYTQQGHITVQPHERSDQIQVTVTDTGPGISNEELSHVFERFWRSEHARVSHPDGSGLGLAIAKRLADLQGGSLEVNSQINQGTSCIVSLPQFNPQFEVH